MCKSETSSDKSGTNFEVICTHSQCASSVFEARYLLYGISSLLLALALLTRLSTQERESACAERFFFSFLEKKNRREAKRPNNKKQRKRNKKKKGKNEHAGSTTIHYTLFCCCNTFSFFFLPSETRAFRRFACDAFNLRSYSLWSVVWLEQRIPLFISLCCWLNDMIVSIKLKYRG